MWLVFKSLAEAERAQAQIWEALKPAFELRNKVQQQSRVTTRWANPQEAKEGWAILIPEKGEKGWAMLEPEKVIEGLGGVLNKQPTFPMQEDI